MTKTEISTVKLTLDMLPKVIVFNSVSVDGSINGFDVDVGLHYEVLGKIGTDCLLAGSNTAKTGIQLFYKTIPVEEAGDLVKPKTEAADNRPVWVIADSRGVLQGLMHVHRRSGYSKDIIVLVSKQTPNAYLTYLSERNYDYIVAGDDHVDFHAALEELNGRFGIRTVVTDSGGVLVSVLLDRELVDELHLLIAPQVVGKNAVNLFRTLDHSARLKLAQSEVIEKHLHLVYAIDKSAQS